MASRLSEESLKAAYASGHQALAIRHDKSLDALREPGVDLEALLLDEDPEAAVQAVPPQPLYRALLARGLEDSLEVLQLVPTLVDHLEHHATSTGAWQRWHVADSVLTPESMNSTVPKNSWVTSSADSPGPANSPATYCVAAVAASPSGTQDGTVGINRR